MTEAILITILILCNGFFALSEIALVSSRALRLQEMAQKGSRYAPLVLSLKGNPEQFLSAIQVGITMVGVVSGMVGGLALAEDFEPLFRGFFPEYAYELSLFMVVSVITYSSILFGELLPKTIALRRPEKAAVLIVPAIRILSVFFRPVVSALSVSTRFLLKILKLDSPPETSLSGEELKMLIRQAYHEGLFDKNEFELYQKFFRLIRREAVQLMKHRTEIVWIDIRGPEAEIQRTIMSEPYSKFIVCDQSLDNVIGILSVKDYLSLPDNQRSDIRPILKEPVFVPLRADAAKIIDLFREQNCSVVLVVDEFGSVQGMITVQDILYQTLGVIGETAEPSEPAVIRRADGSYLVDGQIKLDELPDIIPDIPWQEADNRYATLAGFFYHRFGRLPKSGDFLDEGTYRIEVMDMDGLRIDKFLIRNTGGHL